MLGNAKYCPILYARQAEQKALLHLPLAAKDGLFPLIVGRPWPNAKKLANTWTKIAEAVEGRRYALDLDRFKFNLGKNVPAQVDFNSLFDSNEGYANYYNLIASLPNAVPVLRSDNFSLEGLSLQADRIQKLERGLIVRIEHGQTVNPQFIVDAVQGQIGVRDDVVFVIDAGWSNDLLSRELWATPIIRQILVNQSEAEIVVAGSSFPEEFTDLGQRSIINLEERRLYSRLKQRFNEANLVYGDWGSTRPPRLPTPMTNVPRIDLPTTNDWIAFRRDKEVDATEDYADIASRIVEDDAFKQAPNIWGTVSIRSTAIGLPGSINSPAAATAVRVNIHLHRQRFFDDPRIVDDGDEPFLDNL